MERQQGVEMNWKCTKRNCKRGKRETYQLRFWLKIGTKRGTTSWTIEGKNPTKSHAHLFALMWDIEDRLKDGKELSGESKETIRTLKETDPERVAKWIDDGWFKTVTSFTLEQACDDYIASRGKEKCWTRRTFINSRASKARIGQKIPLNSLVADLTLRTITDALSELRNEYRWSVFEKDFKFLKALYGYLHDNGDIKDDLMRKKTLKAMKPIVVEKREDEFVSLERFQKVLDAFKENELEQKCLFAYWRYMGARKFDPIGDRWEDVDWEEKSIQRYCIKRRAKLETYGRGCPIDPKLLPLLSQWKESVIAKCGKATGPIFPWLNHWHSVQESKENGSDGNVYRYFEDRVRRVEDEPWKPIIKSLRSSRSIEYRRLPNGRFFESIWIGHSEEVADSSYDKLISSDLDLVRKSCCEICDGEAA